jgi:hypothetical protein
MVTITRLKEVLDCDPELGIFRWKIKPNRRIMAGSVAGSINWSGYQVIRIDQVTYRAHRLIWLYVFGEWPKNDIDHINGNRADNRLGNLRDVTTAENIQNQVTAHKRNQTGRLGVAKQGNSFRARICTNGVSRYLGSYTTADEAEAAYREAKRAMHPTSRI